MVFANTVEKATSVMTNNKNDPECVPVERVCFMGTKKHVREYITCAPCSSEYGALQELLQPSQCPLCTPHNANEFVELMI